MDKTSKKILNLMISAPHNQLFYHDQPYKQLDLPKEDFYRSIRYLESHGHLEFISNQNGQHLGASLSHNHVHRKAFALNSFKNWFLSSFLGGVVTGVCSTLVAELLLYLGAKLIGLL